MKTLERLNEDFERERSNPDKRDAAEKALTGEVPVSSNKNDLHEIDENLREEPIKSGTAYIKYDKSAK